MPGIVFNLIMRHKVAYGERLPLGVARGGSQYALDSFLFSSLLVKNSNSENLLCVKTENHITFIRDELLDCLHSYLSNYVTLPLLWINNNRILAVSCGLTQC